MREWEHKQRGSSKGILSSLSTALSRRKHRADGPGMLCSSAEGSKPGSEARGAESKNHSNFFKGRHFVSKVPPLAQFAFKGVEEETSSWWGPSLLLGLSKAVSPPLSYRPVPPHLFLDQDSRHNKQKETWKKWLKAQPPKVHHY